ncbi:MAG: hypothetical protein ACPGNT_05310, partial [Rhodospirillales bacterium]
MVRCSSAESIGFVQEVAAALDPERARHMLGNFTRFLSTSPSAGQVWQAAERISQLVAREGGAALVQGYNQAITAQETEPFIAAVNSHGAGGKCVVFVARVAYYMVLREALHLREQGFSTYLISVEAIGDHIRDLAEQAFDGTIHTRGSYGQLADLVQRIDPMVFHVQCWMWTYGMARLVLESRKTAAVVCEFYDISSAFAPRDALLSNWPQETIDLDLAIERYLMHEADGIIYRFAPWVLDELKDRHGAIPEALRMQSYPSRGSLQYCSDKPSQKDGVIRLVYAGGLIPRDEHNPPELFSLYYLLEAFQSLVAQGFAVDLLHDPFRGGELQLGECDPFGREFPEDADQEDDRVRTRDALR